MVSAIPVIMRGQDSAPSQSHCLWTTRSAAATSPVRAAITAVLTAKNAPLLAASRAGILMMEAGWHPYKLPNNNGDRGAIALA